MFLSESLKAQRTQKTLKVEGFVRIAGLSESLKAQRTQKTLKVEGFSVFSVGSVHSGILTSPLDTCRPAGAYFCMCNVYYTPFARWGWTAQTIVNI